MLYPAELPGPSDQRRGGQNALDKAAAARQALSMNFRFAHRRGASVLARRAVRLCGACAALAGHRSRRRLALPLAASRPGGFKSSASMSASISRLSDGRTVRLGGLDAPNADRGAPEIAKAARDFLSERLARPGGGPYPVGRRDRSLGQDGRRPLLARFARGRPIRPRRRCWRRATRAFGRSSRPAAAPRSGSTIEDGARRAGLGIWRDPEFAVIQSSNLAELRRRDPADLS